MRQLVNFMNYIMINNICYVEVTDQSIPGIRKHCFYVSIFGVVYNSTTHRFSAGHINQRGYVTLELMLENGKRYHTGMHRLLMLVFCYIPGCEKLEVNHIDGVKTNNTLQNLEWVTGQENVIHAYATGLMPKGEGKSNKLKNSDVHEICKMLEQGRYRNQFSDIAYLFNIEPIVVLEIAYGMSWTDISSQYNINYDDKLNHRFSKEDVHKMCNIFISHKNLELPKILDIVITELNLPNTHNVRNRITRIYYKNPGNFYDITSQYEDWN